MKSQKKPSLVGMTVLALFVGAIAQTGGYTAFAATFFVAAGVIFLLAVIEAPRAPRRPRRRAWR